jgi:hypothetical protein
MKELKPSDFTEFPCSSVLQKSEAETVAQNIMKILKRTGDEFRPLSKEEYIDQREIDGNFSRGELSYFDQVIDYCKNADTAQLFSKVWKQDNQ